MPQKPIPESVPSTVYSMTGFGRAVTSSGKGRMVAEIRAVNGRYLKLTVKAPSRYGGLEERVKSLLAEQTVVRGTVEVGLFFDTTGQDAGYAIDEATVATYARQARQVVKRLKLKGDLSIDSLLALPGAVSRVEQNDDLDDVWKRVRPCLLKAIDQFDTMRRKEGAAMACDIQSRLADIHGHWTAMKAASPTSKQSAVARFKERVQKAMKEAGVNAPSSPESLDREVVMLADRLDFSEELARLESHLQQMTGTLSSGGEVGKKLDFLTQELFREINTIGSKCQDLSITHRVVEMKGLVEKIREQVQNLE
jgi:uncharacterized protein (TIGR00255 family)